MDWDKEVVLQNKNLHYESFPGGTFVHDLERGKMADIRKEPWQTDTSIGSNSWGYIKEWKSKDVNKIVDDLVDIVSKNGCLLLNVGPKANGTIPQDQRDFLLEIGKWLAINGEAIYGSRHWKTFGEGPTKVEEGYMSEKKEDGLFTSEDIRFTTKGDQLYAIALDWPENGKLNIKTLRSGADESVAIKNITLLGSTEPLQWNQNEEALHIQLPDEKTGKYAHVLAINR
ncbi:MAG: alpha-L-fucosidase [Bacteroidota bacterium]